MRPKAAFTRPWPAVLIPWEHGPVGALGPQVCAVGCRRHQRHLPQSVATMAKEPLEDQLHMSL
jgi:hypothetical protein